MKQRILLIVAMLLLATPAFAAVTVDVTQGSGADFNKVTVAYTATGGDKVRAFALEFTIEANSPQTNWAGIHDFNRGESNKPGGGYGIFPGQFKLQIDPVNPNWYAQYYYPIAPPNDVDACNTGIGTRKVICELGTLYKDANEPGAVGKLFVLDVNFNGQTTPQGLTVATNSVRGGVVLENGTSLAPTINAPPKLIPQVQPVNIAGDVNLLGLTGRQVPYDANLKVEIYSGTTLIETLTATMTYGGTQGIVHYSTTSTVAPGTYDIKFKAKHWLKRRVAGVTLVAGDNTVNSLNSLINGDVDNNNQIASNDYSLMRANWLQNGSDLPGDLNEDGQVASSDYTQLRANWLLNGD